MPTGVYPEPNISLGWTRGYGVMYGLCNGGPCTKHLLLEHGSAGR